MKGIDMKKIVLIVSLLFLFLFLIVGCEKSSSNNREVDYTLQRQCGEDSEKFYKEKFSFPTPGEHQSHYNKTMNKCFLLVKDSVMETKGLWDVNENKQYGVYYHNHNGITVNCNILDKKCKSEEEFDSLVKPYMND
jgi:hypothetical protein